MDLFCEIPCLTDRSGALNGLDLCKKWFTQADKQNPREALQKFISYNRRHFEFLETIPWIEGTDNESGIAFRTSRYIGAIPLRSPDTGKQIGDFVVAPRFVNRERFEDYIEILDLLGQAISPEVVESLPLASGRNFRPPFYLEAVKFVVALEKVLRKPWRKFDCVEVIRSEPTGQVDWERYLQFESTGEKKLKFPVRQNILSEFHREYLQMRYVFDICDRELRSSNVPIRIRNAFRSRLDFIEQRLYLHAPLPATSFVIKASDRPAVKECKEQANKILNREHSISTAWRVDLNDVFERFVQHIFEKAAHSIGGKFSVSSRLQRSEPGELDQESPGLGPFALLITQELSVFIDAKYKSTLFKRFGGGALGADLHEDIRHLLEYSKRAETDHSVVVICYPSDRVEVRSTRFQDPSGIGPEIVLVVGVPLKRSVISEAVGRIAFVIDDFRGKFQSDR